MSKKEETIGVKTRTVLWYLTFFGFAINYILRINTTIAIVDMIDTNYKRSNNNTTIVTSECNPSANVTLSAKLGNEFKLNDKRNHDSLERRLLDGLGIEYERDGFKWDERQQSQVLGSYFWLSWVSQLPGGVLAGRYGTKLIFGFAHFVASVICLIIPLVSYLDYRWMICLRVFQGLITGMGWPAMHHLTGRWIPPNERSKFVSAYLGSSVGVAIAYPIFGFIIKATSWEWVFHVCGLCGIVWYIFWLYYVYDSPEDHPRIDPAEKEFILQALGSSVTRSGDEKRSIPWKAMLTSKAIWINAIAQFGSIWGILTLLTQVPTYFRFIHGWGIEMTGLLSGIPHLTRVGFSISFSHVADFLLTKNKMSRNNVRNLATFFCMILNGFAVIGLSFSGCDSTLAIIFLVMSLTFHGAISSGALSSVVDIAPNFSGVTLGLVSTIGMTSGFISPIIVGNLTFENQSVEAWRKIFLICACTLFISGTTYILFNDTSVQPWNDVSSSKDKQLQLKTIDGKDDKITKIEVTEKVVE